jgi:hypothetical protein
MILLLGSPRSGTSWIGKVFDSHPDVLYRHEPDTILRSQAIPSFPEPAAVDRHLAEARQYLAALAAARHPKVAGSQPQFRKSYRGAAASAAHRALVLGAKSFEAVAARLGSPLAPPIPDLARTDDRSVCLVIKSVSSLGRALLFSRAAPDARIVHILRHPCGQIASRLRGMRLRLLDGGTYVRSIAATPQARRMGFDEATLEAMSLEEQMACQWLVQNQKVLEEMRESGNYILLNYDGFCLDPERDGRDLFDLVGLDWTEQTRAFITLSSHSGGSSRYFGLFRQSRDELDKWQKELAAGQIERILGVIGRAEIGSLYLSPASARAQPSSGGPERVLPVTPDPPIMPLQPEVA